MSAHVFGKQVVDVRKAVVDQAVDDGKESVCRMAPKDDRFFGNRGAVLNQDISVGLALCKKSAAAPTLRKEAAGRYGDKKKSATSSTSTPTLVLPLVPRRRRIFRRRETTSEESDWTARTIR